MSLSYDEAKTKLIHLILDDPAGFLAGQLSERQPFYNQALRAFDAEENPTIMQLKEYNGDIKEAYQDAVDHIKEIAAIVAKLGEARHPRAFVELLTEACACKDYINDTLSGRRVQIVRAKVIVDGLAEQYAQMRGEINDAALEEKLADVKGVLDNLACVIVGRLRSVYVEQ